MKLPAVITSEPMDVTMDTDQNFNNFEDLLYELDEAIKIGDVDYVNVVLRETNVDVNFCLDGDETPLMRATKNNDVDMVKLLLAHNANPNLPKRLHSKMFSPLWDAMCEGHYKVAELLLRAGADLHEYCDRSQIIFLHEAAVRRDKRMMELLLSFGASVKERDFHGMNALHVAVMAQCDLSVVEMLIKHGADLNELDDHNESVLHTAIYVANEKLVGFLLDKGADISAKTSFGEDPLFLAVKYCSSPTVKLLLSRGADVQHRTLKGKTALHAACRRRSDEKIQLLVENGADLTVRDSKGRTPFRSLQNGSVKAARMMVRQILKADVLGKPVDKDDIKAIQADTPLRIFHDQCLQEIERMKNQKVYNHISYFHIFSKRKTKIVPLLRNPNFTKAYLSKDSKSLFPIYGMDLDRKIRKAKPMKNLLLKMENYLHSAIGSHFPTPVLNRIAYFCNPSDFPMCV